MRKDGDNFLEWQTKKCESDQTKFSLVCLNLVRPAVDLSLNRKFLATA